MQIVIDIPEEVKRAFDCAESNDLKGCYYDHGGVIGNAIKNGTPLPKGHGRLIDADELELDADWDDYYDGYMAYSESMIKYAPTIIDADKESEK